eukprot:660879-Hanusia_phi.AAC.1
MEKSKEKEKEKQYQEEEKDQEAGVTDQGGMRRYEGVERKREGQGGDKAGCSLIAKQCVRSSGCCRAVLLVEQLLCSTATSTVRLPRLALSLISCP